jgi:hypothetical protein
VPVDEILPTYFDDVREAVTALSSFVRKSNHVRGRFDARDLDAAS